MSKIFQLEGGQYEHPNEYKLVSTVRGTTILQPEFGTVIIEGDVIEASTHNTIQKNGVLASKVNVTMESTDTVLVPTDMTIESDLFNGLKIILLFETGTTLPSNSFIKLKETNVPIANVNDYVVNANTPLLFLYFDSKFYAYKAGSGTSTGASKLDDLSDVVVTTPIANQTLVYNGTNFVNKTVEEPASKLDDLSDVTLTTPTNGQALVYNGSKFVNKTVEEPASKLDDLSDVVVTTPTNGQALVYNGTNFVNQTVEEPAGIIKISTTAQVSAGTDNSTAVSPAKLKELFVSGANMSTNGYQKLPSGLIIQWGEATFRETTGETGEVITLPIAFPNAFLRITGTDGGYGANATGITIISESQFRCWGRVVSSGAFSDTGFHWIAIGY